MRVKQLLFVLFKTKPCGLLFQLELGDALTQRIKLAFQAQAPLVAGAQLVGQVVVLAALGTQISFTFQLHTQGRLQARLGCGIRQARQLFFGALLFLRDCLGLLGRDGDGSGQLFAARCQTTQGKLRLLRLALQCALLLAGIV